MRRYIDADKMKSIKNIQSANFNSIESIREWIDVQPTADVFEKDLLTDRPCAVCKYNTTGKGCTQWDCAFGM